MFHPYAEHNEFDRVWDKYSEILGLCEEQLGRGKVSLLQEQLIRQWLTRQGSRVAPEKHATIYSISQQFADLARSLEYSESLEDS